MNINIRLVLLVLVFSCSYSWFTTWRKKVHVNVWLTNHVGKVLSFDNSVHDAKNKVVYFSSESGDSEYTSSDSIYTKTETVIKVRNGKKKVCYYLDRRHCSRRNCYKQAVRRIILVKKMSWLNVTSINRSLGKFKKGSLLAGNFTGMAYEDLCSKVNTYKLIKVITRTTKPYVKYVKVNSLLGDISIEAEFSRSIKLPKLPILSKILRKKLRLRFRSPWGRKRFQVRPLLQASQS